MLEGFCPGRCRRCIRSKVAHTWQKLINKHINKQRTFYSNFFLKKMFVFITRSSIEICMYKDSEEKHVLYYKRFFRDTYSRSFTLSIHFFKVCTVALRRKFNEDSIGLIFEKYLHSIPKKNLCLDFFVSISS